MKNFLKIAIVLLIVFGLVSSAPAVAQQADPATVIQAVYTAIADGNIDKALTMIADDAVLTMIPPPEGTDGSFVGKEEIRGWWESLIQDNSRAEFSDITVSGNAATWKAKWWSDHFETLGVAPAEFEGGNVVEDGLLKTISWRFTPEFLARLDRAATLAANRTLAERFIEEVWHKNQPELIDEFLSEDFVSYAFPKGGREAMKAAVTGFHEELPKGYFLIDETIVTEDKIVLRGSVVAEKPAEGTEPDRLDHWINLMSVKDGKITDRWIGIVPPEEEGEAAAPTQPPVSIKELAGVWWRTKVGYPEPGKYFWQLNPDGTDLLLQEDTVGGKVVRRPSDEFAPGQWSFEGTELHVIIPGSDPTETDLWGCGGNIGRYQLLAAENGGIEFKLIEDTCGYRKDFLVGEVWQRQTK